MHETAVAVGSYNVQYAGGVVLTPSLNEGTLTVVDAQVRQRLRFATSPPRATPASRFP